MHKKTRANACLAHEIGSLLISLAGLKVTARRKARPCCSLGAVPEHLGPVASWMVAFFLAGFYSVTICRRRKFINIFFFF